MKKLPKVYQNTINKKISNNKEICYVEEKNIDIDKILDYIFSTTHYSYNIKVKITTTNKEYNTYLVKRNKDNIITLDNELIYLQDIKDIEIV